MTLAAEKPVHAEQTGRFGDLEIHPRVAKAIDDLGFMAPTPVQAKAIGGLSSVFSVTPDLIGQFIFTGVFDRFPKLQVIWVDTGVGWIPHFVEQMDDRPAGQPEDQTVSFAPAAASEAAHTPVLVQSHFAVPPAPSGFAAAATLPAAASVGTSQRVATCRR